MHCVGQFQSHFMLKQMVVNIVTTETIKGELFLGRNSSVIPCNLAMSHYVQIIVYVLQRQCLTKHEG
jgi:hypothetical protein